jgi:hypothetical protein
MTSIAHPRQRQFTIAPSEEQNDSTKSPDFAETSNLKNPLCCNRKRTNEIHSVSFLFIRLIDGEATLQLLSHFQFRVHDLKHLS